MVHGNDLRAQSDILQVGEDAAAERFQASLRAGLDWFTALLETIASWTAPQEAYQGRHFQYLIGDEAFDWLLLAERLLLSADGLVPDQQQESLLFHGRPPRQLSEQQFKEAIGSAKYRAVRNYWYGVTVEEALLMAVEDEVRKERRTMGRSEEPRLDEVLYQRVYGQPRPALLLQFFQERGQPPAEQLTLAQLREFTYWLFKYRLNHCDKARIASDTKKGLDLLRSLERGPTPG